VLASPRLWMLLLAVAFLAFAFTAATLPATDPDAFWVAAAGRWMLENRAVPWENGFSFADGDKQWVMHEWLFGAPYALGLGQFGPGFFAGVAVLSAAAATAMLVIGTSEAWRFEWPGAAVALFALICFGPRLLTARPANVALSLAIAMAALSFTFDFGRRSLWVVVLLEWVWANVHGSFPLGVALIFAGAVMEREDRWRRLLACALAAAVTLGNPYGPRLHELVWEYLFGASPVQEVIREHVLEFRPLWRADAFLAARSGSVGLVGCGVMALGALLTRGFRVRGFLSLALLAEGVLRVRHLELAGFVTAVLVAPWAAHVTWRGNPLPTRPALRTAVAVVLPGLCVAAVAGAVARPKDPISPLLGGSNAARLAQSLPIDAKVWAPFASTGLVLWYAPEEVRVLYDGRNDCYSPQVAADAFALEVEPLSPEQRRALLDKYGVTYVMGDAAHPVLQAVRGARGWMDFESDGSWVVRTRASTQSPTGGP